MTRLTTAGIGAVFVGLITFGVLHVHEENLEQQRRVWVVCTELMGEEYWSECEPWAREGVRLGVDIEAAARGRLCEAGHGVDT